MADESSKTSNTLEMNIYESIADWESEYACIVNYC